MTQEKARKYLIDWINYVNDPSLVAFIDEPCSSEEILEAMRIGAEALYQHSLPEDLDEATKEYAPDFSNDLTSKAAVEAVRDAFKAGAEWMAGQGVKIGETKIYLEDDGDEFPYSQQWLDLESTEFEIPDGAFDAGDEVDVILRKKH